MRRNSSLHWQVGQTHLLPLLLLSAVLVVILWLANQHLDSFVQIVLQRQQYVSKMVQLHRASYAYIQTQQKAKADQFCHQLAEAEQDSKLFVIPYAFRQVESKGQEREESVAQFILCEKQMLFSKKPSKKIVTSVRDYVNTTQNKHFISTKERSIANKNSKNQPHLLWLDNASLSTFQSKSLSFEPQTKTIEWRLEQDFYGVVITFYPLHIMGKGRIYGTIISEQMVQYEPSITLSYNKNVVETIMNNYAFWQLAERGWSDF